DRCLAPGEPHLRANRCSSRGSRCHRRHGEAVLPQIRICPTQRRPAASVPADAGGSQVEVATILKSLRSIQSNSASAFRRTNWPPSATTPPPKNFRQDFLPGLRSKSQTVGREEWVPIGVPPGFLETSSR